MSMLEIASLRANLYPHPLSYEFVEASREPLPRRFKEKMRVLVGNCAFWYIKILLSLTIVTYYLAWLLYHSIVFIM
jgi:hypothetical protein